MIHLKVALGVAAKNKQLIRDLQVIWTPLDIPFTLIKPEVRVPHLLMAVDLTSGIT